MLSGTPSQESKGGSFIVQVIDAAGNKAFQELTLLSTSSVSENASKNVRARERGVIGTSAANEKTAQLPPKIEDIFNLDKNLIGIFVAAVFGLAPGLLFDRLQNQADRYKADLKSSQSADGAKKS